MEDGFISLFYTSGMSEFVDALSRGPLKRAVEMLRSGDVIPDSRYFLENGADAPVLYIAVTHGRYAIAKEMVQMGASVDDYAERCGVKYPLLVYGMATKDETAVSYFFNHGADVYKAASDGTDALYWACVNGYTNIVSRLIGMGHDVNKYYKDDKNLIEYCCSHKMFEIADLLMKSGKVDLNKVGGDSMKTPLFKSVEENNEEAILFLLRNGADPHTRGYFEPISSVVEAADVSRYYGYTRITRILVDPHKSYMAVVVEAAAAANENVYTLGTGLPGALCSGECTICCDECDEMVPLSECRHVFCVECLRCWFRTLAKQHKPIVCPQEGCGCKCSVYDLRAVLSAEECEEVERRVLVAGLALQPNFVWCPTPGCGSGMFLLEEANGGGGGCTTVTCRDCGKSFCRLCFMDHGEKSCRDKYDEMSSYEWLSTNTKECPNCKARIVKNGGCSHMRCLHCQYEFCWICMNKYTGKYTFGDVDPCRSS